MGAGGENRETNGTWFPLVAMLVCLVLTVLLFLGTTAPALAEQHRLRAREQKLTRLRQWLMRQNAELGAHAQGLRRDPQAVLVEIDRLGLTPKELLEGKDPLEARGR